MSEEWAFCIGFLIGVLAVFLPAALTIWLWSKK